MKTTILADETHENLSQFKPKIKDVTTPTWFEEAKKYGPRKALRRLNEEPHGFYACGMPGLIYNPRASNARIHKGKLEMDVTYSGLIDERITVEGKGLDVREWLDVSEAHNFIDAYGRNIYAS